MTRSPYILVLLFSFLLLAASAGVRGQGSGAVTELDPGFTVAVDLGGHVRLDLYTGREKSEEISAGKYKVGAGISFRLKPKFTRFLDALDTDKQHVLVIGTTYEYSIAREPGATTKEHKIYLDGTFRWAFPKEFLLSNRNRFEFRWVNGEDRFRYRNRLILERPFKLLKRDITPYGGAEAYWDAKYKKWNIFKFTTGVVVPLYRRMSLEFLYERQHCVTCADPNTNIFGLTLNIALRLKKK
jgi:hypothetical protein